MSQLARGTLGVVTLLLIAWLLSERRRLVSWQFVALGILVQVLLAAVLLKLPFTTSVFAQVNRGVVAETSLPPRSPISRNARGEVHVSVTGRIAGLAVAMRRSS